MPTRKIPSGKEWMNQIFKAKAARSGGIVRRKISTVEKFVGEDELKREVKARGFHMLKSGDQYLIFCHQGHFKLIC